MGRRRVLITGAAGRIGRVLREELRDDYELVLVDREAQDPARPGETVQTADLAEAGAADGVITDVDTVIHLAARSDESTFEDILRQNIVATFAVFDAARKARVARVVFASTNRVTERYPAGEMLAPEQPPRPDSLYAVSKCFGEALGRLYFDEHGLEVVCLRIGSFAPRPSEPRHLSTWLSPRDCVRLVRGAIEARGCGFLVVYGVSANTRRRWSDAGWDVLGYRPEDDAETFATAVEGA